MLKEQGNIITENIPITKELLDFALANNYKISLKTGDYSNTNLDNNKPRNNKDLIRQLSELYLNGGFYYTKYHRLFCISKEYMIGMIKRHLGEKYVPATEIYADEIKEQHKLTMLERHGVEYPSQSEEIRAKVKETNIKKFGVDCNFKSKDQQLRVKQKWLETYGVDNPMKHPDIQQKAKQTNRKNLGVDYPMQSQDVREKSKEKCLEVYGVDNPMKASALRIKQQNSLLSHYGVLHPIHSSEIRERMKSTNLKRYGTEFAVASPIIRNKIHSTNIEKYGNCFYAPTFNDIISAFKSDEAIKRFETLVNLKSEPNKRDELFKHITTAYSGSQMYIHLNENGFRNPKYRTPSHIELKLRDWLVNNNIAFEYNYYPEWLRSEETNRKRELDFFIPEYNLAIELNGDFTHSIANGITEDRHIFKFKRCYENNVKLLMFTESEILNEFDMVVNIINYHLKQTDHLPEHNANFDFRYGLKDQIINESTKVEKFEVSQGNFHYYPV